MTTVPRYKIVYISFTDFLYSCSVDTVAAAGIILLDLPVCVHGCLCACGSQRLMLPVFFWHIPPCLLRLSLPLNLEPTDCRLSWLDWSVSSRDLLVSPTLSGCWGYRCCNLLCLSFRLLTFKLLCGC